MTSRQGDFYEKQISGRRGKEITERTQGAGLAVGFAGFTHGAAVKHQTVAKVVGLLGRQDLPKLGFHLGGVTGPVGEAQPSRQADAMSIGDHHTGGVENVSQDEISRFAPYAGQLQKVFHIVGDFPAVIPQEHLRGPGDIPGLCVIEPGGADISLQL
ncbi:hypothetical protein SDC9_141665 [bioreactor metagenome]|uniref:Uncharacterized protein n=1 Tax=bioreactor metagenome TaxID=1076179 RepID=A0A645DZ22_9ZZZZ